MCWKCKKGITLDFISRTAECPECGADLHSCKNCVFYAPGSHYDCHETVDEEVRDKEKANFCDSFKVKRTFSAGSSSARTDAKKAFDSLFSI